MTQKQDIIIFNQYDPKLLPKDFQKKYFTHILCHSGKGQFEMNGKKYDISADDIVILLPSLEFSDLLLSVDFQGIFFLMSHEIATKNNPSQSWGIKGVLFSRENPVVKLSKTEKESCEHFLQELSAINNDAKHLFQKEILEHQLQIFILNMWHIFAQKMEERLHFEGRNIPIFERFLYLLEMYCMEHREVNFYSDKLCISNKYLSEVCKKSSGKTASEWIQTFTTQRLVLLLKNPHLSLTEIADALHFSSLSFFSRYVRKVLGVSPNEFRQKSTFSS